MLKASELNKRNKQKKEDNHKIYKELLQGVYKKIENKNNIGFNSIQVYIPLIQFGLPLYNFEHALLYICRKLKKGGFSYSVSQGNRLFISW
tara:strand:+ start:17648 stop:17920 length:273 start_codon:yes stop_codon:yes gene_type:complete